mmetsp:Transcript_1805/g.3339  ORF Transcript_1805/g.3339 Transcript_1805/m.3339 type:complete len:97 (+) Transcript_1805:172-462(+)
MSSREWVPAALFGLNHTPILSPGTISGPKLTRVDRLDKKAPLLWSTPKTLGVFPALLYGPFQLEYATPQANPPTPQALTLTSQKQWPSPRSANAHP